MDDGVRHALLAMAAADQIVRAELAADGTLFGGYHLRMAVVQRQHAERLVEIMEAHGWPTAALVGEDGAEAAWLVLQHAIGSPTVMRRGLTMLTAAAELGEAEWWQVAYLDDRIRVLEGKPQRYGTQHDWDEHGELSPQPIEDASALDEHRAAVGLEPLADQTRGLRGTAASEGEQPPADWHGYQSAFAAWAHAAGWRD